MEIEINRDLRKYKSKDVWMFTFWQFLWFLAGMATIIGVTVLRYNISGGLQFDLLTFIPATPFLAIGFIEIKGMNLIQYMKNVFPEKFLMKRQLVWKSEFLYDEDTGKEYFGEDCELIPIIREDEGIDNKKNNSKTKHRKERKK